MKLTIEQPALASALAKVTGIIETKNTLPILANVLIAAEDNQLTIRATDLDIEVTTRVECTVDKPGSTTLDAKILSDGVKRLAKGSQVVIDATDTKCDVTSGRRKFSLAQLPASDFPTIASEEYDSSFAISIDDLSRLFGKSAFAMSTEEVNYYLNGIYLHPTNDGITAVATDGHRLAKVWSDQNEDFQGVIVPRKTVGIVRNVFTIGDVELSISGGKIRIDAGDTVIVSKVIDGNFPDYDRIIPQSMPNSFRVDAVEFASACAAVAIVCEDKKSRAVAMDIGDDAVRLEVAGHVNDAEDVVDAYVSGDPVRIGFNSRYLADAMAQAEGGDMIVHYKGPGDPALMKPTDDDKMLIVVMPVRV